MREDGFSYGESMLHLLTVYFSRSVLNSENIHCMWAHWSHLWGCKAVAAQHLMTLPFLWCQRKVLSSYQWWKHKGQSHFSQFAWLVSITLCLVFQSKLEGWLGLVRSKYLLLFTLPGATGAQHSCMSVSRGLCKKIKVVGSDLMLFRKAIYGRGWSGVQLLGKGHPPHLPFSLQDTFWLLQPRT